MRKLTNYFCVALCVVALTGAIGAAEWGDLTGTFIYGGKAPEPAALKVDKDVAVCGKHKLVDESLVVGADGGIKNIVVFLYLKEGDKAPPIHPSYEESAKDDVVLDNRNCRFEPRVALLRTTQKLVIKNSDPVGHNTKIDCLNNTGINPLIPAGAQFDQHFTAVERVPSIVSCNIHPWMSARVLIKDHPYMAVTDDAGKFTIKNLPVGKWTFQVWQEKAGYVQEVSLDGKKTKWQRGRVEVEIKASGEDMPNSLGTLKLAPEVFKK
jgi:hypothetical protein